MKRFRDTDYFVDECGNVYRDGYMKKPQLNKNGYYQTTIWKNNSVKRFYIHRLVAELYCENQNNYNEVNHIDGCKANNNSSNLEWISHSENINHAVKTSLIDKKGMKNSASKLSETDVRNIRKEYVKNCKLNGSTALSKKYGVHTAQIMRIVNRERWGWLD